MPDPSRELPAPCRRDVEDLVERTRATRDEGRPGAARAPDEARAVLVTGATGFIGPLLVHALRQARPEVDVWCLVRGRDDKSARERLREALGRAGQGAEEGLHRLRVIAGDVRQNRLGLAPPAYEALAGEVDAIYHLAADLRLTGPYDALKGTNVTGTGHVLDLAVRGHLKHLFFASSLGVFPQYFRGFTERNDKPVREPDRPDLMDMRRTFPLGLMGYPWTKLVVEEALGRLATRGLPVAVLRLPQTGRTSYGPAQPDDLQARILAAAMEVGVRPPEGPGKVFDDPADLVAGQMAALLGVRERAHLVYHCCEHRPSAASLEMKDFGVAVEKVSYARFRAACRERGERSPLSAHWPLLDHMARWWFAEPSGRATVPVEACAIEAETGQRTRWPGPLTQELRREDWIRANPDRWPLPRREPVLNAELILERGRERAREAGIAFDQVCPKRTAEDLTRAVAALRDPEKGVRDDRIGRAAYILGEYLRRAVDLRATLAEHPEIERERVRRPVFIVGMARTGTTLIQRLLARDPRFQTLSTVELNEPFPARRACGRDPREYALARYLDVTEASEVRQALKGVHAVDASEPEEEYVLMRPAFRTWGAVAWCRTPAWYVEWLRGADMTPSYALHAEHLKYFQHARGAAARERTWLLKSPLHLFELEALLEQYPDARFIATHRDRYRMTGSWCSLIERLHGLLARPYAREQLGREQLELISLMHERTVSFRARHRELRSRWIDVEYDRLSSDPLGVAAEVRTRLGWGAEPAGDERQWLARQLAGRRAERRHRYDHRDYGLSREQIDEALHEGTGKARR